MNQQNLHELTGKHSTQRYYIKLHEYLFISIWILSTSFSVLNYILNIFFKIKITTLLIYYYF